MKNNTIPRGIYFLKQGDNIVYIGQSVNIHNRVKQHAIENTKVFDSFSYKIVDENLSLDDIEVEEIVKYRPKYNLTLPSNNKYTNISYVRDMFGKSICDIIEPVFNVIKIGKKKYIDIDEVEEVKASLLKSVHSFRDNNIFKV